MCIPYHSMNCCTILCRHRSPIGKSLEQNLQSPCILSFLYQYLASTFRLETRNIPLRRGCIVHRKTHSGTFRLQSTRKCSFDLYPMGCLLCKKDTPLCHHNLFYSQSNLQFCLGHMIGLRMLKRILACTGCTQGSLCRLTYTAHRRSKGHLGPSCWHSPTFSPRYQEDQPDCLKTRQQVSYWSTWYIPLQCTAYIPWSKLFAECLR